MPIELSEMTLEAVLRTVSSVKGHRTRCEKEIDNLLGLLGVQYSSTSEERINDRLEKLERLENLPASGRFFLLSLRTNPIYLDSFDSNSACPLL